MSPPIAVIIAAIPVRTPGPVVQNDPPSGALSGWGLRGMDARGYRASASSSKIGAL